jgi:hypothetical protein
MNWVAVSTRICRWVMGGRSVWVLRIFIYAPLGGYYGRLDPAILAGVDFDPTTNQQSCRSYYFKLHPACLAVDKYPSFSSATMNYSWLRLSLFAICWWGAAAFAPSPRVINSSTSLYGVRSAVRRARDSLLSKERTDSDLKDGIAFFYDRSSKLWEDVWGEHMHQ